MTKKELEKRIAWLEQRVAQLEAGQLRQINQPVRRYISPTIAPHPFPYEVWYANTQDVKYTA